MTSHVRSALWTLSLLEPNCELRQLFGLAIIWAARMHTRKIQFWVARTRVNLLIFNCIFFFKSIFFLMKT